MNAIAVRLFFQRRKQLIRKPLEGGISTDWPLDALNQEHVIPDEIRGSIWILVLTLVMRSTNGRSVMDAHLQCLDKHALAVIPQCGSMAQ